MSIARAMSATGLWKPKARRCSYAAIAISLLVVGASRQLELRRTLATGEPARVN